MLSKEHSIVYDVMTCYDYVQVVAAEGEQKASLHLKVQFDLI